MVNQVTVNGRSRRVVDALSSGPGEAAHTFELSGGAYVYRIAGVWWLQERGQFKREVEVGQ